MNQANLRNLTLFDLLARHWEGLAPVEAIRFGADNGAVAFACADGTVAIATMTDAEPPEARIRVSGDLGQAAIRPREKTPAPVAVSTVLHERAPPLVAAGSGGFIVGTVDGTVLDLAGDATVKGARARIERPVAALDVSWASGVIAVADEVAVRLSQGPGDLSERLADGGDGEVVAVRFSHDGRHLAIARTESLSVATLDGSGDVPLAFGLLGRPISLEWSDDGQWLACTLGTGGFVLVDLATGRTGTVTGFPGPTRDASWSRPAAALVASGAFRVAAWSMNAPPLDGDMSGALVSGRAGLVAVEAVAAHPLKPLAAAGYANGQILLTQIGGREELLIKPSGGAVFALGWSADGHHMAAGTADGTISITTFPAQMFK